MMGFRFRFNGSCYAYQQFKKEQDLKHFGMQFCNVFAKAHNYLCVAKQFFVGPELEQFKK
jgi:hypothetical protein